MASELRYSGWVALGGKRWWLADVGYGDEELLAVVPSRQDGDPGDDVPDLAVSVASEAELRAIAERAGLGGEIEPFAY